MTKREFLTQVAAMGGEVGEYAAAEIEKMEAAVAARKEKPTKAQIENRELLANAIEAGLIPTELQPAAVIAEALELNVHKATAVLKMGVADGTIVVEDMKIPKKGTQKCYKLA